MDIDVPNVLLDIGLVSARPIQRPPHLARSELWIGEEDSITSKGTQVRVLFLHSSFSEDNISGLKQKLASVGAGSIQLVLFEDSMPEFELLPKVQSAFPEAVHMTIAVALRQSIFRNQQIEDPAKVDYFVPPTIVPAEGGSVSGTAVSALVAWIRGARNRPAPSRVGILLAPAGTGKTALSIELFKECLGYFRREAKPARVMEWPFPLLIDRFAWIDQNFSEGSDTLAEVISNAIYQQFRFRPPTERIQRCLRYGAISPILDGFDELCASNPFVFGADETIAGLIAALEGIQGSRILLTCRESFWHDNVDVSLQAKVSAFRLSPFSEAQRREYLEKRFPSPSEVIKRDRTLSLLQKISSTRVLGQSKKAANEFGSIAYLPWVVQFAAEATDTTVLTHSAFDSAGSVPEIDPVGHILWQFCRREQQRIGISLSTESQIRFFTSLAAITDEWFPADKINWLHELLAGDPDYKGEAVHIEFLRKHGFLHIVGSTTHNNCRFEYPEVQDYLRARVAVDAICGAPAVVGDVEVFSRCSKEQTRLVDFISLLLRWRLSEDEIIKVLIGQRVRIESSSESNSEAALAGLLQIVLRVFRDDTNTSSEVAENLCRYFGDSNGRKICNSTLSGRFSRLDFSGVRFQGSRLKDVYFEHCLFDSETIFEACTFDGEFGAATNCRRVGEIQFLQCDLSEAAKSTLRQHQNNVGRVQISRSHIEDACQRILRQFNIGQVGLRSKSYDDVEHEASKASSIGNEILAELIASEVLRVKKAGTRKSIEVSDRGAVGAFLQQSTPRGAMAKALDRIVSRHLGQRG